VEVIRSVTHLVLARVQRGNSLPLFIEPKGAGQSTDGSRLPPARLFRASDFYSLELTCFKPNSCCQHCAQPAGWRVPKTFSARPCSFSSKGIVVRAGLTELPRVQPVFDSRHGRITCKAFLRLQLFWRGKQPSPISHKGSRSNPSRWLTAALPNHAAAFTANSGNIRLGS
jgi:hypothetical protein